MLLETVSEEERSRPIVGWEKIEKVNGILLDPPCCACVSETGGE